MTTYRRPPSDSLWALPVQKPAPHNGTATSKAAAKAIEPHRDSQAGRVLAFVRASGQHGATREEIADGLQMRLASVCARVSELVADSKIIGRGKRPASSGHEVEVLVAKENP